MLADARQLTTEDTEGNRGREIGEALFGSRLIPIRLFVFPVFFGFFKFSSVRLCVLCG
jgi:hypothetical protein